MLWIIGPKRGLLLEIVTNVLTNPNNKTTDALHNPDWRFTYSHCAYI